MSCLGNSADLFVPNFTLREVSDTQVLYHDMAHYIKGVVFPVVFSFGIAGNSLNIAVFTQKRLRHGLDKIELSATMGLLALSISDLLFCIAGFPAVFLDKYARELGLDLRTKIAFIYNMYKTGFMNVFLFTSTWLIVLVALERYVAVCHLFKARSIIRIRRTVASQICVVVISFILTFPVFLTYKVGTGPCLGGCECLVRIPWILMMNPRLAMAHKILWFTLGTLVPMTLLILCNSRILYELYQSSKRGIAEAETHSTCRITLILVTMVFMFLFMVFPSTILYFSQMFIDFKTKSHKFVHSYRIAILLSNLTQAVKFSCNFLLYCSINKKFRETASRGRCVGTSTKTSSGEGTSNRYQLVEVTSQRTQMTTKNDSYFS